MSHLYVKLVEREQQRFQQRIALLGRWLTLMIAAETIAGRLTAGATSASADACEQGRPFVAMKAPVETLMGKDMPAWLSEQLGETVIRYQPGHGEYLVLLDDTDDEGQTLRLKVAAY